VFGFNVLLAGLSDPSQFIILKHQLAIYIILAASVIFLLFTKYQKASWSLALAASVIALFDPLPIVVNPSYAEGSLLSLIVSISQGDPVTAFLLLLLSLIPVMIIIFAISKLTKNENKKFDKLAALIFVAIFFLSNILDPLIKGIFSVVEYVKPVLLSLLFIIIFVIWNNVEKDDLDEKKQNK